jgi:uncharacterized protein YkwD
MRPPLLTVALAVTAATALAPASAGAACAGDTAPLDGLPLPSARGVVLCSINAERAAAGLRPVALERHLQRAAQAHSADMVTRRYFAHTSPEGRTLTRRARSAGYLRGTLSWALGEAIGWGPQGVDTSAALTRAWIESPPHRAILLAGRYRDLGIGVAAGVPDVAGGAGVTAVLDFGRRAMRRSLRAWRSRIACARTQRASSRTPARCASTRKRSTR